MKQCTCHCGNQAKMPMCRPTASTIRYVTTVSLHSQRRRVLKFDPLNKTSHMAKASSSDAGPEPPADVDTTALPENFCLIESRESVKNFANMQLDEIKSNITSRRNRIFLLMEEVRRLKIQQRLKGDPDSREEQLGEEQFPSVIPLFPPTNEKTLQRYTQFYILAVGLIIGFGGIISPSLELKLGLGGTSYYEFITSLALPTQLAEVDPIVASFCGGAVGVLTALLLVEMNNAKQQERRRCIYCEGTGYLPCGNCLGTGVTDNNCPCGFCASTGKVMCTACLCTGKKLVTEHDPRVDPFDLSIE